MSKTVRLTQSTDASALTLLGTPHSDESASDVPIDLAVGLHLSAGTFPLGGGKVKYGFTGGTLKIDLRAAHFTHFSEEMQHHLPITKFPTMTHPTWKFALPAGLNVLEIDVESILLGSLTPTAENWSVDASLTIGKSELLITEVEGLWRHDLRPNKQAILHRKIALFLLENYLPSPLISIQMDASVTKEKTSPTTTETSGLLSTIEDLIDAESNDFLELCEIADLNPRLDFAGANLRGTTLRGLDLNGANWSRVNLRGAELTDADLSQGNLQGAKLSGADLSGAYLSNANLKNSDFHRASLALANLSGANLEGANLQEANLSQANLNDCNLEGAKFDD
ncbi:pentapeptide repeat protein [Halothece sp. PCC 7418]|uniref:pentapeptide repeat-containing protein n=1 Tax=Halothece sp. (strain PCC 7418) TaxID=65093 RepID=UPI0002A05DDB|nr:pentapeptide repeat-containing protein [Halothece sp. PCC 7418]AFZ45326.1 pentapeptide repeat protein [Halothece sp. PCC 7418]